MRAEGFWVSEAWEDVEIRYRVKTLLHEEKTRFQELLLVDSYEYGRMLLLDGVVQTSEKDEFVYHEMMVHVPMLAHVNPKNVLIIGGGDGGILREILKYRSVEKATMVEIDPVVIDICRKYLPELSRGAFEDVRTQVVIEDGASYVRETDEQFDVIIVDSPDPLGPARILFSQEFYGDVNSIMAPDGIMVRQTGSIHMQRKEQEEACLRLSGLFQYASFYVYSVPTYVGGLFSTIFCSNVIDPLNLSREELYGRFDRNALKTRYYDPAVHVGAFCLPPFMRERLT